MQYSIWKIEKLVMKKFLKSVIDVLDLRAFKASSTYPLKI